MFLSRPLLSPPLARQPASSIYHCGLVWSVLGYCTETITFWATQCLASFIHCQSLWTLNIMLHQRLKVVVIMPRNHCWTNSNIQLLSLTFIQLRRMASNKEACLGVHPPLGQKMELIHSFRMLSHEICLHGQSQNTGSILWHRGPTTGHRGSTTGHRRSATGHGVSSTGHSGSTTGHRVSTTGQ